MSIIRWRDRFAAFARRVWAVKGLVELLIIAAIIATICAFSGCADAPADRGTAVEHAADANARAASNARAADSAEVAAAKAKAKADQLSAEAKARPTEERIAAAADARVDAAAARAVADALDKQSAKANDEARKADEDARTERAAEAKAADDRAWLHFCRIIGLIGVVTGALLAGILIWLTKSPTPGVYVGGGIAGIGMLVVAFGATVTWLPLVLAAAVVVGLFAWALLHRKTNLVAAEGLQTADDAVDRLQELGKTVPAAAVHAAEVKAAAVARQYAAKIKGRVELGLQQIRAQVSKA